MRIAPAIFVVSVACSPAGICYSQTPANTTPAQNEAPPAHTAPAQNDASVAQTAPAPSALLKPALDAMQQTLESVKTTRWKRGTVREEAEANINDIQMELQETLPPVMAAADAAPGSLPKMLPVAHHVDLLYDVLLRVVEASRVSAPGDDVTQLQQALVGLGNARRSLSDRLLEAAGAQEKQVIDLQGALKAQAAAAHAAPPPPAPAPCPAATTAHKPRKKTPPAAKPQTPPASAPTKQ